MAKIGIEVTNTLNGNKMLIITLKMVNALPSSDELMVARILLVVSI